ncbi:MAG TPA: nucleotidyltransferase domain-containing protein [Desulfosporosinus sp.]|nr:nucleotidyltransferase domain-containing protein [Desulfosporosinus sp.]
MARLTNSEQIALKTVTQHIRNVCLDNLVSLTLYGSKARGDSTYESDIDILILVKSKADVDRDRLYDFLMFDDIGYDLNFSLNIYEAHYFNHLASIHAPFVENVLREGEMLWTT